ncbi:MAG TPA: TetR family transcriptional regulator [Solirubrobacteraceae bacterium]|nr:TetR family transcriptional regulator [Solirubrobacteraceae bacterium]
MSAQAPPKSARRRPKHDPKDSEREILQAAEELIRERPLREVTVASIMLRTGLKRPAFWTHFRDRNDVILRIAERISKELVTASNTWLEGDLPTGTDLTHAIERATMVYAEHSAVLRALADAAPTDEQAEAAYRGIVESLVDAGTRRIRAEQSNGTISRQIDAEETTRALLWMNERYLYQSMGRSPRPHVAKMTAVLSHIWLAALYGAGPPAKAQVQTGTVPDGVS